MSDSEGPSQPTSLLARWSERDPVSLAPSPLPDQGPRHRRRRAHVRRAHRRRNRILLVIAAVVVLLVASGAAYVEYLNHEITRLQVHGITKSYNGTENFLLVGSTTRCGLPQQNQAFGLCSQGVTGVNSDVVMILHLDPNLHTASILSIPRDLFVPNARSSGANKIDAALYQGPSQLVAAVEEDFGIPIQHFVVLNFDSFQGVVDALGGVKMYFPMPLYDAYSSLNIPTAGCHQLNGFQALAVVRARHLQYKPPGVTTTDHYYWPYDPQSDLSRIRRDHEFLRVLATQVSKRGLGNPLTDNSIASAVAPQLQVDQDLGLTDLVSLALAFHSVNPNTAPQWTMPVLVHSGLDYYYQGYDYGSVELPSEPQDQNIVAQFLGQKPGMSTDTGKPLPSPGSVTVSVLNGSGVYNQASRTAGQLQALGFDVVSTGDSTQRSSGSDSETLVYYSANNVTARARAEAVAQSLTGAVVLAVGPTTGGAEVTVVTGSDFAVNSPASSTTAPPAGSATSGTSATTTSAPAPTSSTLGTPTAPTQSLAPFDPRSCTPSGGEGP